MCSSCSNGPSVILYYYLSLSLNIHFYGLIVTSPGQFIFLTILFSVDGGLEVDCEGYFVLIADPEQTQGGTDGEDHITLVSFNKHFLTFIYL